MAMSEIRIDDTDINEVAVRTTITGDRLTGTVLENKQVFDRYSDMIVTHFNALCDYANTLTPEGDAGLDYTPTEVTYMTGVLGCNPGDIEL